MSASIVGVFLHLVSFIIIIIIISSSSVVLV